MGQQRELSKQCWIQLEMFWQLLVYLVLFGLVQPNMLLKCVIACSKKNIVVPVTLLTGKKPSVLQFYPFGCKAFRYVDAIFRSDSKMQSRSEYGI